MDIHPLSAIDQKLSRLPRGAIPALTVCGVLIVGTIDYLTGYEASVSLFYLVPVAVGAWYDGRDTAIAIAVLSGISWYIVDMAVGNRYSHPAIGVWNALISLGFFLVYSLLLTALRKNLLTQQSLARTDALTGLSGRRVFEERLSYDLALAHRQGTPVTIAYVDVDDFKLVNDTCGHAEGDRLLRLIGGVLKDSIRETDIAARLGGDEFALILLDTDDSGAQAFMLKLTRTLRDALQAGSRSVTCSIGIVTLLDSTTSPERAIAMADQLMYDVKRRGKGTVAFNVIGKSSQARFAPPC
jgi:diguanylate cyclase (GGDEF)-like protein